MAYYYKIGLLVLNNDASKFLVCEKDKNDVTNQYIMPGGQMVETTVEECLKNRMHRELNCEVDFSSLKRIDEYIDRAAGDPDRDVVIDLYQGKLIGDPKPAEVKALHWIGKEDAHNPMVSSIIRNHIIPDLVKRGILH